MAKRFETGAVLPAKKLSRLKARTQDALAVKRAQAPGRCGLIAAGRGKLQLNEITFISLAAGPREQLRIRNCFKRLRAKARTYMH